MYSQGRKLFNAKPHHRNHFAVGYNSNHFADYIGTLTDDLKFSDVPVKGLVSTLLYPCLRHQLHHGHLPLFPTIGDFNVFWDSSNVSPTDVATLKQEHPNVKVALNLGSDSVVGNPVYFNPISVDSSVANAVSSLTTIIQAYHLCGPDVYYEHFKVEISHHFCVDM
ncbi:hypothetical protein HPP92_024853 [Vanilla planifolia]|uniref:GH18 domain-containing protein n=1 Tax=Vanilla planifolia TaxID=51239 RepID=A0A835UDN4_VANPL|nr:hypothetical protein HPP92_024853 [Vanilla planifolia]